MELNWYKRVIFYCVICFAIGPFYDGWASTILTLIRAGVYGDPYDTDFEDGNKSQILALYSLLSYFRIGEFCSSIIWGIVLDSWLGPRYTILVGICLRFFSWLLIAYAHSINGMMIFAALISGISTNAITLPCYTIAVYRLDWREYGMCLLSVSLSLSSFYCWILNLIYDSMGLTTAGHFILVSQLLFVIPIGIACWFVFPRRLVDDVKHDQTSEYGNWSWKGFYQQLIRPEMRLITLIFVVNCFSLMFVQDTFIIQYGNHDAAVTSNVFAIPFSALFSLFFMWFIKRFGVLLVLLLLNCFWLIMHLCMLSSSAAAGVIVSICISITFSGFITFFFIYLDYIVPPTFCSSSKGFLVTIGGLACLINILMTHLSPLVSALLHTTTVALIILRILLFVPFWVLIRNRV